MHFFFLSHFGFLPLSPLHFDLLGVLYAMYMLLFKFLLIFAMLLRFGFPLSLIENGHFTIGPNN